MIKFKVTKKSQQQLFNQLIGKTVALRELKSVRTKSQISDAMFSLAAPRFISQTHALAASDPSSFHHIYEWEQVGDEGGRLYRIIKRKNTGGSITVYGRFKNSKKKVPIHPVLKVPGPTGKVVTRSGVFKRKAEVMEKNKTVRWKAERNVAFQRNNQIIFKRAGTNFMNQNPGGKSTTRAFTKHFSLWWRTKAPLVLDQRGVYLDLEKNISRQLSKPINQSPSQAKAAVRNTISRVLSKYKNTGSYV